jgi:alkanesulfonate monooxygenase SsuD/methylene tetrahydromethanopterin reductase-like flavin-dependent oxidoreductase (luciferase family)
MWWIPSSFIVALAPCSCFCNYCTIGYMDVKLGVFAVPDATDPAATVGQLIAADRAGLDVAGVQDHPYQRRFFDTWTLLAYVAGRTERIRLVPDVTNLPLRPPAMLAKAAASLDVLSGGRVEVGLGAGAFWEAVEAMGGPRRTPKESVDALEEAIAILRAFWDGEASLRFEGEHYRVSGARPGPPPAHRIGIWIGAYGPRMLRLTGRLGDGWLPSLGGSYLGAEDALRMQGVIDEAARAAGRAPEDVERAVNVMALEGEPGAWPDRLARIASELRFTTLLVAAPGDDDPAGFVRRLGEDIAPRVRELLG